MQKFLCYISPSLESFVQLYREVELRKRDLIGDAYK